MSRLNELKKQYPELNISVFDMMVRMDVTKSYKYIPLMCKIFNKRYDVKTMYSSDSREDYINDITRYLEEKGISSSSLSSNEKSALFQITDFYNNETFSIIKEFMEYNELGKIEKSDVTSYSNIEELRSAVSLAEIKELSKELESQIIKEFEDDKWLILRPLTFAASSKYGAGTRWCTTYKKEKNYFEKYWRSGVLVYFINKQTGYKFAGYRHLNSERELSFWNAEDTRVDYLSVEADDYIFPIVKKIFSSELSNKNLCSNEIQEQVHEECLNYSEKLGLIPVEQPDVEPEVARIAEDIADAVDGEVLNRLREATREYEQTVVNMNARHWETTVA